jgi:hypothetical protein
MLFVALSTGEKVVPFYMKNLFFHNCEKQLQCGKNITDNVRTKHGKLLLDYYPAERIYRSSLVVKSVPIDELNYMVNDWDCYKYLASQCILYCQEEKIPNLYWPEVESLNYIYDVYTENLFEFEESGESSEEWFGVMPPDFDIWENIYACKNQPTSYNDKLLAKRNFENEKDLPLLCNMCDSCKETRLFIERNVEKYFYPNKKIKSRF